jgi:hypothetical protein
MGKGKPTFSSFCFTVPHLESHLGNGINHPRLLAAEGKGGRRKGEVDVVQRGRSRGGS